MTKPTEEGEKWKRLLALTCSWDRVASEIENWDLPGLDATQVLERVTEASLRFVPEDFGPGQEITTVEEEKTRGFFKGVRDLVIRKDLETQVITVVDWKTTGKVDPKWEAVHRKGWQFLWYGALEWPPPEGWSLEVEFRGIERSGRIPRKTLKVPFGFDDHREASRLVGLVDYLRSQDTYPEGQSLRFGGYTCYAFGQPCPYLGDRCDNDPGPTFEEFDVLATAPISPTSAERIRTCPRKNTLYQLDKLRGTGDTDKGNDASRFGNAFHSGIAEVYRQLAEARSEDPSVFEV